MRITGQTPSGDAAMQYCGDYGAKLHRLAIPTPYPPGGESEERRLRRDRPALIGDRDGLFLDARNRPMR
jgi:hypothetical protein